MVYQNSIPRYRNRPYRMPVICMNLIKWSNSRILLCAIAANNGGSPWPRWPPDWRYVLREPQ